MNFLVTGGSGYIGSHTVLALLDQAETQPENEILVVSVDWNPPSYVINDIHKKRFISISNDVGDKPAIDNIMKMFNIQHVIHTAADVSVPDSFKDPNQYYYNNVEVTRRLLEVCVDNKIDTFTFSSSAAVYGNEVTEDFKTYPQSPYGRSKMMAEMLIADICPKHDIASNILRYFNVAGADAKLRSGQGENSNHLIKEACRVALGKKDQLSIYNFGYDVRDYIHVSDVAYINMKCAFDRARPIVDETKLSEYERMKRDSFIYDFRPRVPKFHNIGTGRGYSTSEIVEFVKFVTKKDIPFHHSYGRGKEPKKLVSGSSEFELTNSSILNIIESAYRWEARENP